MIFILDALHFKVRGFFFIDWKGISPKEAKMETPRRKMMFENTLRKAWRKERQGPALRDASPQSFSKFCAHQESSRKIRLRLRYVGQVCDQNYYAHLTAARPKEA